MVGMVGRRSESVLLLAVVVAGGLGCPTRTVYYDAGSAAGAGGRAGIGGQAAGGVGGGAGHDDGGGTDTASCAATTATLPSAPTLLRPMRGAYTGSLHSPPVRATLRPTLTWSPVAPTCGPVTYQVQLDDSCQPGALATCAFPSPEVDAPGIAATRYTPSQDLKVATAPPVGAFYAWRVRACDASARCGAWSEVRYLHVGRVREDINGDGYGDLLAMSTRGIEVYLGASQFNTSDSSYTLTYTSGFLPSFVGDVNDDGFGDVFGSASYAPTAGMAPILYLGNVDVTAVQTVTLTKSVGKPSTLMQTNSAGDLNGDGFADLIVQWSYNLTSPQTELRIFWGGPTLSNTADLSIPGPYVNDYTLQHSGRVGDVNGDGFEDVALTAVSDGGSNGGVMQIFAGGVRPTSTAMATVVTGVGSYSIVPAGDVNSDGYDDVVTILPLTGYYLYEGGSQPPAVFANSWTDDAATGGVGSFDLDGDGIADFVIGRGSTPLPVFYRGSMTGPTAVSGALGSVRASETITVSDNDGDGRPDVVGASSQSTNMQVVWAGSNGSTNPPSAQLLLSDQNTQLTGQIVR